MVIIPVAAPVIRLVAFEKPDFFARFMQWDEKKHVRVVIDYDPAAEKVLLLRCPVTAEEEAQHTGGETE